eukprot:15444974-Alexandrium_andersonii.AAC.1
MSLCVRVRRSTSVRRAGFQFRVSKFAAPGFATASPLRGACSALGPRRTMSSTRKGSSPLAC